MQNMRIKVTTLAFSKDPELVAELRRHFPDSVVNVEGVRYKDDALVQYLADADAAIVGLEKISGALLDKLPRLKMVSKFGVGLDNVDLEACKQRNVEVGWTPGVNKTSVAEQALGFMLMLCRNLYTTSNELKRMEWNKNGGVNLSGKTIGIIGLGHIGQELVRLLAPFHCNIIANDIADRNAFASAHNIRMVSKEVLLADADIISIHAPLTNETERLFTMDFFEKMKPTSFIINTARGGIIDEHDLKQALQSGTIAGAALDVFKEEPPADRELLGIPNLINTPHVSGNSKEAVRAMGLSAIQHLQHFFAGRY